MFFKWCKRNDLITRDLLADYEVRNAPRPHKYMLTNEDMGKLADAMQGFYDVSRHPDAWNASPDKRSFHRERNCAIFLTLLDSACRIGEVLSFKRDDYQASSAHLSVRERVRGESRAVSRSFRFGAALLIVKDSVAFRFLQRVMLQLEILILT